MTIRSKLTMTAIAVTVLANSLLLLVALQYVEHVLDEGGADAGRAGPELRTGGLSQPHRADRRLSAPGVGPDAGRRRRATTIGQGSSRSWTGASQPRHGFSRRWSMRAAKSLCRRGARTAAATIFPAMRSWRGCWERKTRQRHDRPFGRSNWPWRGGLAGGLASQLVATAAARPTADTVRSDGMIVAAAVPVFDARGRLAAVLYAGDLLSRRYEIVDAIRRQVFLRAAYKGQDIGTVAISQDDLRVATTFALADGSRAVGTRLSARRGRRGAGPRPHLDGAAFVINDWYLTAYEPIRDPPGGSSACCPWACCRRLSFTSSTWSPASCWPSS